MKKIYIIIMLTVSLFGWEINTHRAFDIKALKNVPNLDKFVVNANVKDKIYRNEQFDDYDMTYFDYVTNGETNGISDKKWKQKFKKYNFRDLIEAGIILEDAQWPHWGILELPLVEYIFDRGDGRFNNHFYDAQDNGNDLTYGIDVRKNALQWAKGAKSPYPGINPYYKSNGNNYDYGDAIGYFIKGFTVEKMNDRKSYQAKAFVSVGHVMHMMNDMKVEV